MWEDQEINNIVNTLKTNRRIKNFRSSLLPKFVFICGKQILDENGKILPDQELVDNIRYYILQQLEKQHEQLDYGKDVKIANCVLSEELYNQDLAEDILSFEELLAEISDCIIIVAESPGTYCELGAFVLNNKFMKKTIVINEDNPDYKNSFITRGPVKKVKDNDPERVILHNGLGRIKISTEFNEKIKIIAREKVEIEPIQKDAELDVKFLIYEFANIVEIFQPIEGYEIQEIFKKIFEIDKYDIRNKRQNKINSMKKVIELMEAMKLVNKVNGMYYLNKAFSFYNVIATINRKEFNELRLRYLSRVYKLEPKRLEK